MKFVKAITLAFATGFGGVSAAIVSPTLLANAAVGDAIYETGGGEMDITGAQAACYADCAIAAGSWDGARADMVKACARKTKQGTFKAMTIGHKSAPLIDVPVGSTVHGVVVE